MKVKTNRKQTLIRSQRGSLITVMCTLFIGVFIGIGAFAMDIAHLAGVRHQLQNACDAAAYAGAMDLSKEPENCETDARQVALENMADGVVVSDGQSHNMNVDVSVVPGTTTTFGTVTVTASMDIVHMMGPIFNRFTDTITCSATAGAAGKLIGMYGNGAFPIAVAASALEGKDVGDGITLDFNSQTYKNAAFTSLTESNANANWLKSAFDTMLGITNTNGGGHVVNGNSNAGNTDTVAIPPVNIGDDIYLNNGIDGQKMLGNDPYYGAILHEEVIFMPVIDGDPAYNQTREVVGFVGIHFTTIVKQGSNGIVLQMIGTLEMPMTQGMSLDYVPSTGNPTWDTALNNLEPGVVKLIR